MLTNGRTPFIACSCPSNLVNQTSALSKRVHDEYLLSLDGKNKHDQNSCIYSLLYSQDRLGSVAEAASEGNISQTRREFLGS